MEGSFFWRAVACFLEEAVVKAVKTGKSLFLGSQSPTGAGAAAGVRCALLPPGSPCKGGRAAIALPKALNLGLSSSLALWCPSSGTPLGCIAGVHPGSGLGLGAHAGRQVRVHSVLCGPPGAPPWRGFNKLDISAPGLSHGPGSGPAHLWAVLGPGEARPPRCVAFREAPARPPDSPRGTGCHEGPALAAGKASLRAAGCPGFLSTDLQLVSSAGSFWVSCSFSDLFLIVWFPSLQFL